MSHPFSLSTSPEETLSALLGAAGIIVLLVVLGVAIATAGGYAWLKRKSP